MTYNNILKSYKDDSGNFVYCIIGYNRTGKTSKAKEILKLWRKNHALGKVIKFDPQAKMRDENKNDTFIYSNDKRFYSKIYSYKLNDKTGEGEYTPTWKKENGCILILDDYRLLNKNHQPDEWLETVMNFKAEWNMDIIYICHSPRLVLNYLTTFTTHYYIYYTKAVEGAFDDKIAEYDLCNKSSNIMRGYRKLYGRGTYPNFPHCIVVTDEEKIKTQNITKNQLDYIRENYLTKK